MPEGEQGQMPEGDPPEMPEGEQRQFPGGQGMMPGQETDSAVRISAGDLLEIRDAEDNVLWSAEAPKSAEHIVYSSEELKEGEVYYLYTDSDSCKDCLR